MLLKTVLTLFLKPVDWLLTAVKFKSAVMLKTVNMSLIIILRYRSRNIFVWEVGVEKNSYSHIDDVLRPRSQYRQSQKWGESAMM
ncbi:hypothetical protein Pcaca03_38530 [Pectobacterium carotovorum subsp. carotovorum]|uniref:Uncharacterized protein n=2 Tax=Pectobacterium carotovorum TaxID=554 RepID=A0AAI9L5E7_PECCC|nr:hypothetical protein SOASR016_36660 [Pectobacterium carotovorum subsp. carotovorum]GLV71409.1 hypothetical protein Pcaca03_38530 [Pectobacterium carotovorum subsp. carotovorum]